MRISSDFRQQYTPPPPRNPGGTGDRWIPLTNGQQRGKQVAGTKPLPESVLEYC